MLDIAEFFCTKIIVKFKEYYTIRYISQMWNKSGLESECEAIAWKEKGVLKEFKGIWIPYEVLTDKKLNDKEKTIYSMILSLSKENDCTISNKYIGNLLNICNVQASRIINSLKKKGYITVKIIYKQNSKEIASRKIIPINKCVNTPKQISDEPINKNVKDIINNNKIYNKDNCRLKNGRDYSNFDWTSLYANNFWEKTCIKFQTELISHTKWRWYYIG